MTKRALTAFISIACCALMTVGCAGEANDEEEVVAASSEQAISGCLGWLPPLRVTSFTYLRSGPSDGYAILAGVGAGAVVQVLNSCPIANNYYRVNVFGRVGYIRGDRLAVIGIDVG